MAPGTPVAIGATALLVAAITLGFMGTSGTDAAPEDRERWDRRYAAEGYVTGTEPVQFLKEHVDLLPRGKALDLAMGEGRNGVYLAGLGFEVTGLDISEQGLRKAQALAAQRGVTIQTQVVDLEGYQLPADAYDVIVCTYYLQRDLFPQITRALKPGGMAVVETYTVDHLKYRPKIRRDYLLAPNELLRLFTGVRVLRYQERDDGTKAYASILVRKPPASSASAD